MPDAMPQPLTRLAFSFPAEPASIPEIRHLVVAEAQSLPFSQDDVDDMALAISEAFTNLVQYAPGHRIRGFCEITTEHLEVRFEVEPTMSRYLGRTQFPTGLSHSGRGIPLLHLLLPIVEVQERPDGMSELRLAKPIPRKKESA